MSSRLVLAIFLSAAAAVACGDGNGDSKKETEALRERVNASLSKSAALDAQLGAALASNASLVQRVGNLEAQVALASLQRVGDKSATFDSQADKTTAQSLPPSETLSLS